MVIAWVHRHASGTGNQLSFYFPSGLPALPTPLAQEEIAAKSARLQRVAAATGTARQQAAGLAAECQAERERLLEDIRRLNAQMKQKVGMEG